MRVCFGRYSTCPSCVSCECAYSGDLFDQQILQPSARTSATRFASARNVVAKLNLEGTPMFLVGDRYLQGMPENFYEELTKRVAEVRAEGCKICRADKSPS